MISPLTNQRRQQRHLLWVVRPVALPVVSLFALFLLSISIQFVSSFTIQQQKQQQQQLTIRIQNNLAKMTLSQIFLTNKAGTFFNEIPESNSDDDDDDDEDEYNEAERLKQALLVSTSGIGFKIPKNEKIKLNTIQKIITPNNNAKSFVGIGPPLNDITKPEYDENGYTLYADETTGKKSRVFEALVTYPCKFTLKIVGDGSTNSKLFIKDILVIVAQSCNVNITTNDDTNDNDDDSIFNIIQHTTRTNGKWISITVQAPVENAEMLYQLYENIDQDPRVKFKF